MSKDIFIHIGYPKTATTTLQKHLFAKHKELIDLRDYDKGEQWLYDLLYLNEISFKKKTNNYAKALLERVEFLSDHRKKAIIYSNESLISNSLFFTQEPKYFNRYLDPISTARKLHLLFSKLPFNIKIIIVIREQTDLLKSNYAQLYNYCFKDYYETRHFKSFTKQLLTLGINSSILSTLLYYDVIKGYENVFQENNVSVLLFEELKDNPEKFCKKLEEIMSLSPASTHGLIDSKAENIKNLKGCYKTDSRDLGFYLKKYKIKLFGDRNLPFQKYLRLFNYIKVPGKKLNNITYTKEHYDKMRQFFEENNNCLCKEYDLPLKKYGYKISEQK